MNIFKQTSKIGLLAVIVLLCINPISASAADTNLTGTSGLSASPAGTVSLDITLANDPAALAKPAFIMWDFVFDPAIIQSITLTDPNGGQVLVDAMKSITCAEFDLGDYQCQIYDFEGIYVPIESGILGNFEFQLFDTVATETSVQMQNLFITDFGDGSGNVLTSSADTINITINQPAPSDTTAPSVSVTSPASGATASSTITLIADSSDNVGVTGVQFKLDQADIGAEISSSPYSMSWDTSAASDGSHTIVAVSRDAAGNVATSSDVSVTVDNTAPVISATSTSAVTTSGATINWTTDESADSKVEYGADTSYGSATSLDSSLVTSHSVGITGLSAGTTYHFRITTKDTLGNTATSSDSTFTTGTPPPPPSNPPAQSSGGGGGGGGGSGSSSGRSGGGGGGGTVVSQTALTPSQSVVEALLKQLQSLIAQLNKMLAGNINKDLSLGSEGQDVKNLQIFLNNNGFTVSPDGIGSPGKESNYFGGKTSVALAKFQKANNLSATGRLDTLTRSKLATFSGNSVVSGTSASSSYGASVFQAFAAPTRALGLGLKGQDVRALQEILVKKGYLATNNLNGTFDSATETAVKSFQCAENIICSGTAEETGFGTVGPKTRAKLGL